MDALLRFAPFALEGQWHGAAAVALVLVGVVIFIGTIYILLVAIYGWLQAYLVTMVALMSFSIILAAVWLFGIPGTIPGTGPRGTEPHWVVFLADSEQGAEFAREIKEFPARTVAPKGDSFPGTAWRVPDPDEHYPGQVSAAGEIDNIKGVLFPALAGYFQKQKTGSSDPEAYAFRLEGAKPTPDEEKLPIARVLFYPDGTVNKIDSETEKVLETIRADDPAPRLLVGIDLPATANHPAVRVFAFRDKGRVFQASAEWMIVSVVLFGLHLWWLAAYENKQKRREEELAAGTTPQPVAAG